MSITFNCPPPNEKLKKKKENPKNIANDKKSGTKDSR